MGTIWSFKTADEYQISPYEINQNLQRPLLKGTRHWMIQREHVFNYFGKFDSQ